MFLCVQTFSAISAPGPMTTKLGNMQPHTYGCKHAIMIDILRTAEYSNYVDLL